MDCLFVDDELSLLNQAEIFLEKKKPDLNIETARSADEAFEILKENRFDVIVLDYQMPGTNGLEFFEKVREEMSTDVPFIMFTGKGKEEVAMEALNLGVDRYLQKRGDPKTQYSKLLEVIEEEAESNNSNERYETIVENINEAIYIYRDGSLLYANEKATELTGYNKDELTDINVKSIIHQDDRKKIEGFEEMREEGHDPPSTFEIRIITKDDDLKQLHLTVSQIDYKGQKAILGSARDVREM